MYKATMFLNKVSNSALTDDAMSRFISAYLSFRQTGLTEIEAVQFSRDIAGIEELNKESFARHVVRYLKEVVPTLILTEESERFLYNQLIADGHLEHKVCALWQLMEFNKCINVENITLSYYQEMIGSDEYMDHLGNKNAYVLLKHMSILMSVFHQFCDSHLEYFSMQFANLRTLCHHLDDSFGALSDYMKVMSDILFAKSLLKRSVSVDFAQRQFDRNNAVRVLNQANFELQEMMTSNHFQLLDECLLVKKVDVYNKRVAQQMMDDLAQAITEAKHLSVG